MKHLLKVEIALDENLYHKILTCLFNKQITIEDYIFELIKKDLNSIIVLGNGFIFCREKEKIYTKENNEIHLTKKEYKLFKLLIDNVNEIVSLEDIYKEGFTSVYTLRNNVMAIRNKIYPKLIINISNSGYEMNLQQN